MAYNKPISYSGMSLWNKCPKWWHDVYINGNRGESGPAADRGTRLHNMLENFFNGAPYPSGDSTLRTYQEYIESLTKYNPSAEGELAVLSDWSPCGYEEPSAYARGKLDLKYEHEGTQFIYDWKSGKQYDSHADQGQMYVALSPLSDEYIVRFVYLDIPHVVTQAVYTKDDALSFREQISEVIEEIRAAEDWPGTPGDHCRWCPLSWRNGGECKRAR